MTYRNLFIVTLAFCSVTSCHEDSDVLGIPVIPEEPVEPGIKIANLPKTTYLLGETPNFDDLTVTEVFTDGSEEIVVCDIQWAGNKFKSGTSVVTIMAKDTTMTFDIVFEKKLVDTGLPVVYVDTEGGHAIKSKETYVNAQMTIVDKGRTISENTLRIRGRGNATWGHPKKPYKVKLDKKINLLGMGEDKDWALLANYCDKTLMRTSIAFKLSNILNFPWTPKARFVELVLNGEYMGNYQLVESVKQDKNRVDIPKTGFIIERSAYYLQEPIWFKTGRGYGYSFKNPDTEDLTEDQINYIKDYMKEFETVLSSTSFDDPKNGYSKYINTESFVKWFLFQQIIANMDTNQYMIKEDMTNISKLLMGPVWDFEWSLGIGWYDGDRPKPADYYVWRSGLYYDRLLKDAGFTSELQRMWEKYHNKITIDILQYMDDMQKEIMKSQSLNFQRWDILNTRISVGGIPLGSFEKEVECDRQFFINRMDWLKTAIYNIN